MTFTFKIMMQPFEVAFEAGSVKEAVAILQDPENELAGLAALANGAAPPAEQEVEQADNAEPKKRGRKPKAAVEAVAPPPIPVPAVPPVPAAASADTGIPPFLDRTNPASVAPPPPPVPAAPAPTPAAPPPVGVLAPKVVAELQSRASGSADGGKALVDWLAAAGLCVPGASFQEAIDCVSFLTDDKLGPVAAGLKITG